MSAAIVALSCGVLLLNAGGELLLCHATGTSRWDIPKGLAEAGESPLRTAVRETAEETGIELDADALLDLGRFAYRRGKDLHLYVALIEPIDPATCVCRSTFVDRFGRTVREMDRFEWVPFERMHERVGKSMAALLGRLPLPALLARLVSA